MGTTVIANRQVLADRQLPSGGGAGFSDSFKIGIKSNDSNVAPTDNATFKLSLSQSDTNASQTETVKLALPSPDFGDSNIAPSETRTISMKVWLSGSAGTGVTSPTNADGANNGIVATLQTAPTGTNPLIMTSALGANVPNVTVTSVIFRGWFKSVNTLITSTTTLTLRSSTALFADIIIFSNAAANTTIDNLSGTFTYNLITGGINTLAKIQSVQLICKTQDAAAGVSPAVLTVDAGAIEITGAF